MEGLPAEQACGDYEWNAVTEEDEGLGEVESSGGQAACGDCQKSASFTRDSPC
jgi:hypothetical protein